MTPSGRLADVLQIRALIFLATRPKHKLDLSGRLELEWDTRCREGWKKIKINPMVETGTRYVKCGKWGFRMEIRGIPNVRGRSDGVFGQYIKGTGSLEWNIDGKSERYVLWVAKTSESIRGFQIATGLRRSKRSAIVKLRVQWMEALPYKEVFDLIWDIGWKTYTYIPFKAPLNTAIEFLSRTFFFCFVLLGCQLSAPSFSD